VYKIHCTIGMYVHVCICPILDVSEIELTNEKDCFFIPIQPTLVITSGSTPYFHIRETLDFFTIFHIQRQQHDEQK
jgi:hypothetical protein